ncbi:hypothetical protein RhiJN_07869 [Ceratobasidium sp. AG-Ba]|nr:hypothetical protein RhiJN_07869 [Ceratobasidium sp. AG-Ba]
MSKRKTTAGGYEASSDGLDVKSQGTGNQASKRSKPTSHLLPQLSTSQVGLGAFRVPASSFGRGSVPPRHVSVASTLSNRPSPLPVPEYRPSPDLDSMVKNNRTLTGAAHNAAHSEPVASLKVPISQRSTLPLERQVNEMAEAFERSSSANKERQQAIDSILAQILAAPTPALRAIVVKVVAEAQSRIEKKKTSPFENSNKEHARKTMYQMLKIKAIKDIRAPFDNKHRRPDMLPAEFIDPATGSGTPYPDWRAALTSNMAWIPTYILLFRTTVPNDGSEVLTELQSLSDEHIVTYLHNGPYKTAQAHWRNLKKSKDEIDEMRQAAWRYQRTDKKVNLQTLYIKRVPGLQNPKYEYLKHPGFMSQDESDDDGVLVTKQPVYCAQWQTNVYMAIDAADRESTKGNKSWRQQYPEELWKCSYLLDMSASQKPDVDLFLEKYPISSQDLEVEDEPSDKQVQGEAVTGFSEGGGRATLAESCPSFDYPGEEESGAVLELPVDWPGGSAMTPDIPIDPTLLTEEAAHASVQHSVALSQDFTPSDSVRPEHVEATPELPNAQELITHFPNSDMPPRRQLIPTRFSPTTRRTTQPSQRLRLRRAR